MKIPTALVRGDRMNGVWVHKAHDARNSSAFRLTLTWLRRHPRHLGPWLASSYQP